MTAVVTYDTTEDREVAEDKRLISQEDLRVAVADRKAFLDQPGIKHLLSQPRLRSFVFLPAAESPPTDEPDR